MLMLPGNPERAYAQGARLLQKGPFEEAIAYLELATESYSASVKLKGLWMHALITAGKPVEAACLGAGFLLRHPHDTSLLGWMNELVKNASYKDTRILEALAPLDFPTGRVLYIRALTAARNATEAMARYEALIKEDPAHRALLTERQFGALLRESKCYEAAEPMLWRAIRAEPGNLTLLRLYIENLLDQSELIYPEKFTDARKLAELLYKEHPGHPEAIFSTAIVWYRASRIDLCLPYFREFYRKCPDHAARAGFVFNLNYDEMLSRERLKQEHLDWNKRFMRLTRCERVELARNSSLHHRLRVGYVSPDLGLHPVGFFAIPVIARHDHEAVEVFIYSHRDSVSEHDSLSKRLMEAVGEDHFRWIHRLSTRELLKQIAADEIDILVDLAGHSTGNRLDVFANRAAPIQASWLGYPNSTWLPNMDFRISDAIVEPKDEADEWSSEEIYRMPNGFHALEMEADLPEPSPSPCLEKGYLTFGSFNNINKLGSRTIELWAALLRAVPDSRLLLKHKTMQVMENREGIRSLFTLQGIHPARIRFKGITKDRQQHFCSYGEIDIALDPVGYNGTTTTCEALYMGVPVLTLPGNTHSSRVSSSLLHRLGMSGWVAHDEARYLAVGRHAAANFEALAARRGRLRKDFLNSPLSDTRGLAGDLEEAYRFFSKRYHQNSMPPVYRINTAKRTEKSS